MNDQTGIEVRVLLKGAFECKDADGNVVKVIEFTGSLPLEQVQELKETQDGADGSK